VGMTSIASGIEVCYPPGMPKQTFSQIRSQHPSAYLLLFNYDEVNLPDSQVEIISAEEAQPFDSGDAMLDAFKAQRGSY